MLRVIVQDPDQPDTREVFTRVNVSARRAKDGLRLVFDRVFGARRGRLNDWFAWTHLSGWDDA